MLVGKYQNTNNTKSYLRRIKSKQEKENVANEETEDGKYRQNMLDFAHSQRNGYK